MTTGEAIKAFRKSLGLHQREFGDLLGYQQTTVAHWESDFAEPSVQAKAALVKLALAPPPAKAPPPPKRTFPTCFTDQREYNLWLEIARQTKARSICSDCTQEYKDAMVSLGRCEHPRITPGRDTDLMEDKVLTGKGVKT